MRDHTFTFAVANIESYEGFEVLTEVVMKSSTFWDIMLCNPLKENGRFGGTFRFHVQVEELIKQETR
jgi:hypothetical protein